MINANTERFNFLYKMSLENLVQIKQRSLIPEEAIDHLISGTTVNPCYNDGICFQNIVIKIRFLLLNFLMSRMICKRNLVLFLFPHRKYVLNTLESPHSHQ